VFFYLYFGRPAFAGANTFEVLAMHRSRAIVFPQAAPVGVVKLVSRLCAKVPLNRPRADEIEHLIRELLREVTA
jgi:hypothetical protein